MALTVSQQPQLYTPAYNKQTITALSNQIAVADFKYIVTVQVNGGTIFTQNILQRPDGYVVYDPIEIVKNYIDRSYFNPKISTGAGFGLANGKYATVEVKVKEYYTSAIQSTTTINYTVWDACLTEYEFSTFNYNGYITPTGADLLPLDSNSIPDNRVSLNNGNYFIHFFRLAARHIACNLKNELGISVGTFSLDFNTGIMIYADLGYATCVAKGFTPLDNYILEYSITNVTNTVLYSSSFMFKDICTKYTEYALYYLTRSGKINLFNFELVSQETYANKKTSVRLSPNKITSGVYGSNQYDREVYTASSQITKSIDLNTNWITEDQSESLKDLFDSPIVFIKELFNNRIFAVDIKETSFKKSKHENEPLFNYNVKCEYSIQENRQRAI